MDVTSAEGLSKIATLVRSPPKIIHARCLQGDRAQRLIDLLDQASDSGEVSPVPWVTMRQVLALPHLDERVSRRSSQLLYKICKARGMLPVSYVIQPEHTHVGEFGWGGGFADVSKGEYQGRSVAIKHLRVRTKDKFDNAFKVGNQNQPMHCSCLLSTKQLCWEVLIWKRLSHPNVLPLLGVSVSRDPQYFRIVSEWMPNGNVMEYIRSNPQTNRLRLVSPAIRFP